MYAFPFHDRTSVGDIWHSSSTWFALFPQQPPVLQECVVMLTLLVHMYLCYLSTLT